MKAGQGTPVHIDRVLLNDHTMSVSLLSYGAITQGWWINDTPLILGYEDPQDYLTDPYYLGAIVGRVANRIGGADMQLDGIRYPLSANEGANTLHGGATGLSRQNWTLSQAAENEVVLGFVSPDGDNGFPGEVQFEVRVSLNYPRLTYAISARPDRPTPISIAQHNYYSLGSASSIVDTCLQLASDRLLDTDEHGVPTGQLRQVHDVGLDFTLSKPIGSALRAIDNFFVFDPQRSPQNPIAEVEAGSGLKLSVYSDQPGAQVYSVAHLSAPFNREGGVCIEPSGYPNAINVASFPPIIYSPDNPYRQTLDLEISGMRA